MNQDVLKRLAESLTARSTDVIAYLPYLLQDFWSLSCDADAMVHLLKTNTAFDENCRLLDLACGKGAASIALTREFGCMVKGIDIIAAFIDEAVVKAQLYNAHQCEFVVGDVNEAIAFERDYDLTIWSGAGDLFGTYEKTVERICHTVKPGGYILLDEAYIADKHKKLRFHHDYLTNKQWLEAFEENGLIIVAGHEYNQEENPCDYAGELENIKLRADELIQLHPEKRELFEDYVRSQQAEYEDVQDGLVACLWLLQKSV